MTVMEAIEARRSIRAYENRPIEPQKLRLVLEAGRLAPSACNEQDWKFVTVTDRALIEKLVDACCGQKFVGQAPAVLAVCANNARDMRCGQPARTIDCSIALSFMMLEAQEQGLGACWLGSFLPDEVRRVLHIPQEYSVVAVTPLGYPAEPGRPHSRKEMDQVAVENLWDA